MNDNDDRLDLVKSMKNTIERILKLDISDEDEDLQYCFKVLIFDDYVFDIICPLLKVKLFLKNLALYTTRVQRLPSYEHKRK
jgi:hypothetical protein